LSGRRCRAGGDLDGFALAELMGHSDVSVAREYMQATNAAQAEVLVALGDRQPLKSLGQRGRSSTRQALSARLSSGATLTAVLRELAIT
jgi:hypothetical protein